MKTPLNILIVEDDDDIRMLCAHVAGRFGNVVEAEGIAIAFEKIETQRFDIAIFDNRVVGGQTVDATIELFRFHNPQALMLMISGSDLEKQMEVGGPNARSLPKPFNPMEALGPVLEDMVVELQAMEQLASAA
jgi:DNA-binding response OmpR family regulator